MRFIPRSEVKKIQESEAWHTLEGQDVSELQDSMVCFGLPVARTLGTEAFWQFTMEWVLGSGQVLCATSYITPGTLWGSIPIWLSTTSVVTDADST